MAGQVPRADHPSYRRIVHRNPGAASRRAIDQWTRSARRGRVHRGCGPVPLEDSMLKKVISAVIGTRHDREAKRIRPIVDAINAEYARLQKVSDEHLRGQTERLRGIIRERTAELEAKVAELKD